MLYEVITFIPYCWRHIPEESVFDLSGSKKDKFALYYDGYVRLDASKMDWLQAITIHKTSDFNSTILG